MFFNSFKFKAISWKYAVDEDFAKVNVPVEEAEIIFNMFASQYLGLGFGMSFIPGTNAYRARRNFSAQLASAVAKVNAGPLQQETPLFWLNVKTRLLGPVFYLLLLGPLWQSIINVGKYLDGKEREIRLNFVTIDRLITHLPLLRDIFSAHSITGALKNLFHTLLNPVRLISQSLAFAQMLIYGTLETFLGFIGGRDESNFLVKSLKTLVAIPFALASLIVSPVEKVFDIPYQIISGIGGFFADAIAQAFNKNITSKGLEEVLAKSEATLNPDVKKDKKPVVSSGSTHSRVLAGLGGNNNAQIRQDLDNDDAANQVSTGEIPSQIVSTQNEISRSSHNDIDYDHYDDDQLTPKRNSF